jgi:hypothetical protein
MRTAAIPPFVAFELASGLALAQGASDPLAHLRSCSLMEPAERLECLDKLSRNIVPPRVAAPATGNWTISETKSPVDYTPMVVATATARGGADESALQLSAYCRNGRTELVLAGADIADAGKDYAVTYRINGGQPVQSAVGTPSFGTGAAFKGDVVRLLQSLPEEGDIAIRLSPRTAAAREGLFSLTGFKIVREKLAAACDWPRTVAKPR